MTLPSHRRRRHRVKYTALAPGLVSAETPTAKPPAKPFLDRIGQGWGRAVISPRVVRRRKRIVLLPVIGALAPVAILGSFLAATALALGLSLTQLLLAATYLVPLLFAGTTTKSVLVAVVYRYGTTGEIPAEFRGTMDRGPHVTVPAK